MAELILNSTLAKEVGDYVVETAPKQDKLVLSGIVAPNAILTAGLSARGQVFSLPFFTDIMSATAQQGNSDFEDKGTLEHIGLGEQLARKMSKNHGFKEVEIQGMLLGASPLQAISTQVVQKTLFERQKSFVAMLNGVTAHDGVDGGTAADLTIVSGAGGLTIAKVIVALATEFGENSDLTAWNIALNPVDYATQIQSVEANRAGVTAATDLSVSRWFGLGVVQSSQVTIGQAILFRSGVVAGASIPHPSGAAEVERDARAGALNGGSILIARDLFGYHINGVSFTGTPASALGMPTDAELAVSTNYTLVLPKEKIGVRKITWTA